MNTSPSDSALKARAAPTVFEQDAVINQPVTNELVSYIASVGVGSPATSCKQLYYVVHAKNTGANDASDCNQSTSLSIPEAPTPGLALARHSSPLLLASRAATEWYVCSYLFQSTRD